MNIERMTIRGYVVGPIWCMFPSVKDCLLEDWPGPYCLEDDD